MTVHHPSSLQAPRRAHAAILTGFAVVALSFSASAATVFFSNDFTSAPTGFTTTGFTATTLPALPVDSGGVTTSKYLGLFADVDFADLSLTGLTPGTVYGVSFDLFAGKTLDGNNTTFGPDKFTLSTGLTTLVDATFSNFTSSTQTYSDATPTGGTSKDAFTGADVVNFGDAQYAIYYFGHGAASNPQLSFIATGPTATLRFAASGLQGETDEFFAIDNVIITAPDPGNGTSVPDTGTTLFMLGSALLAIVCIRRVATA